MCSLLVSRGRGELPFKRKATTNTLVPRETGLGQVGGSSVNATATLQKTTIRSLPITDGSAVASI